MSRQSRQGVDKRIDRQVAAEILSISQRTLDRYIKSKRLYSRKAAGHIWLDEEDVLCFKKAREQGVLENPTRQHQGIKEDENYGIIKLDTSRQGVDKVDTDTQLSATQEKVLELLGQKVLHNTHGAKLAVRNEANNHDKIEDYGIAQSLHRINQEVQVAIPEYTPTHTYPQQFSHYYSEGIYQKLYEELKEEHKHNQRRIEAANYKVGQLEAQVRSMVPLLEYRKQKEGFRKLEVGLKTMVEKREIQLKKARRLLQSEQMNKWIFAILALTLIALQPIIWLIQR